MTPAKSAVLIPQIFPSSCSLCSNLLYVDLGRRILAFSSRSHGVDHSDIKVIRHHYSPSQTKTTSGNHRQSTHNTTSTRREEYEEHYLQHDDSVAIKYDPHHWTRDNIAHHKSDTRPYERLPFQKKETDTKVHFHYSKKIGNWVAKEKETAQDDCSLTEGKPFPTWNDIHKSSVLPNREGKTNPQEEVYQSSRLCGNKIKTKNDYTAVSKSESVSDKNSYAPSADASREPVSGKLTKELRNNERFVAVSLDRACAMLGLCSRSEASRFITMVITTFNCSS